MARRHEGGTERLAATRNRNLTQPDPTRPTRQPGGLPPVSGNRHEPRRADDRVRVRGVPVRRPARRAHAAVGLRDAARRHADRSSTRRRTSGCRRCAIACRASTPCSTRTATPTTCSGLDDLRRYNHLQRRAHPVLRRCPDDGRVAAHVRLHLRPGDAGRRRAARDRSVRRPRRLQPGRRGGRSRCRSGTAAGWCRATGSARWPTSPTAARFRTAPGSCSTASTSS